MRIITSPVSTGVILNQADGVTYNGSIITNDGTGSRSAVYANFAGADFRNLGTVGDAGTPIGIEFKNDSTIINGSEVAKGALITGGFYGVYVTSGSLTMTNFGTVSANSAGIRCDGGGTFTNGSPTDTTANLHGGTAEGVSFLGGRGTVTNYGAIQSDSFDGVEFDSGGAVTNGSAALTASQIAGGRGGVELVAGAGTVTNFGKISGSEADSFGLASEGSTVALTVNNGSPTSTTAAISGGVGVNSISVATITNYGTITDIPASQSGVAVSLQAGGVLTNGGTTSVAALIQGNFIGADLLKSTTVTNYAKIVGGGIGIVFEGGGTLINGSATNHTATIGTGLDGVDANGSAAVTVTNYGILSGSVSALALGGGADKLIVEPGSQLIGAVDGGAGLDTLAFAGAVNMSLANFAHFETVTLANATNGLVLTDAMVASSDNGHILTIVGGSGNDAVNATAVTTAADRVYITAGAGNDTLVGGAGLDLFTFNAADLTSSDLVSGGGGTQIDTLLFTSAGTIAASAFTNVSHIEQILLANGTNSLTLTDALATSADDGHILHVSGGTGADTINAAAITTATNRVVFIGGGGADVLTAGAGADIFSYLAASDSTSTGYDTITGANFAADRIDVPGGAGTITMVETARSGALDSGANFDTELANAFSTLAAHHAGLLTASSGTLSGQTFLVVDLNGTAGYQSGADLVIHLTGATGTLATTDFI